MISERSVFRAASLHGAVPRRRTAFARVKTVDVEPGDVEPGDFVGVVRRRFVGVNNETVRFTETGVIGVAGISIRT